MSSLNRPRSKPHQRNYLSAVTTSPKLASPKLQISSSFRSGPTSTMTAEQLPAGAVPPLPDPVNRKRTRAASQSDILPDPSLYKKRKASNVREKFDSIQEMNLTLLSDRKLNKISEDNKIAWAISKYGCTVIVSLSSALNNIPSSLTSHQRQRIIKDTIPEIDSDDIADLSSFLEHHCRTLLQSLKTTSLPPSTTPQVIAPPVEACYSCGCNLVAYHSCNVKLYTVSGMCCAKKFTLRCKECRILYNYAQYGDKKIVDFDFTHHSSHMLKQQIQYSSQGNY